MYLVKETLLFSKWLSKLKDIRGKVSIIRRIDRMKQGNFEEIIVLLVGGDKSTQINDIIKAKNMVKEYSNE